MLFCVEILWINLAQCFAGRCKIVVHVPLFCTLNATKFLIWGALTLLEDYYIFQTNETKYSVIKLPKQGVEMFGYAAVSNIVSPTMSLTIIM